MITNFWKKAVLFNVERGSGGHGGGPDPWQNDDMLAQAFCDALRGQMSDYQGYIDTTLGINHDNIEAIAVAIQIRAEEVGEMLDLLSPRLRNIVIEINRLPEEFRTDPEMLLQRFRNIDLSSPPPPEA